LEELMRISTAVLFAVLGGCVPREEYLAKQLEADRYRTLYQEETDKNIGLGARLGELAARMGQLEEDARRLAVGARTTEQRKEELERKSAEYERLAASLKQEIEAGRIELSELRGRTLVKMRDRILFASGKASVGPEGRRALGKVAEALVGLQGRSVRVEGHTDDRPTAPGSPFPTNWELSSARAIAVLRVLQAQGVDPRLLAAVGYAQYQPVASNETAAGRGQNRRIEIALVAAEGGSPARQPPP
jgi:chemotaxis protein MotB